jgi:hypothetical protein
LALKQHDQGYQTGCRIRHSVSPSQIAFAITVYEFIVAAKYVNF